MLDEKEKEQLQKFYQDRDLYDPSIAPEQKPSHFAPKMPRDGEGLCMGGESNGYADGGDVKGYWAAGGVEGNDLLSGTDGGVGIGTTTDENLKDGLVNQKSPQMAQPPAMIPQNTARKATSMPAEPLISQGSYQGPPQATPAPVPFSQTDQYNDLVSGLKPSMGQRFGLGAMSGLAGLADAISTGVAKTSASPGFQKNIMENEQNRKANLLNALKAKYEMGYKGEELKQGAGRLAEEERANREREKETVSARGLTQQAQNLERDKYLAQQALEQKKITAEEYKTAIDQGQHAGSLWNKIKGLVNMGMPGPNPELLAKAQGSSAGNPTSGPYGPTTVRNGKIYEWSPVSGQYHRAK